MIFVLIVVALFIVVSIYFYFRSEKLQQELRATRREFSQYKKNNKAMADMVAIVANRQEEFAKFRLKSIQEQEFGSNKTIEKQIECITPLINNYGAIFGACLTTKGQLKPMCEKCFEGLNPGSFKGFVTYLNGKESHVRKMWSSNNLIGFISLVEALLTDLNDSVNATKQERAKELA